MKTNTVVTMLLSFILLVGCATPNITAVDQTGRPIPMPHYVLHSMDDNYQVIYYWAKYTGGRDIDGTPLSFPAYFDYTKDDEIDPSKVSKVTLTIEVLNRDRRRYELWERSVMHDRQGRFISRGGILGFSNQQMRVFQFELPIDKNLKTVEYSVDFVNSYGQPIMFFGSYEYEVKSTGKGGEFRQEPFTQK